MTVEYPFLNYSTKRLLSHVSLEQRLQTLNKELAVLRERFNQKYPEIPCRKYDQKRKLYKRLLDSNFKIRNIAKLEMEILKTETYQLTEVSTEIQSLREQLDSLIPVSY